jgi:hypothetical protein
MPKHSIGLLEGSKLNNTFFYQDPGNSTQFLSNNCAILEGFCIDQFVCRDAILSSPVIFSSPCMLYRRQLELRFAAPVDSERI